MAMIQVPRAEIIELLGLSPDVDNATLQAAMEAAIARGKQHEVTAAQASREQQLRAEDRRLVNAAFKSQ